MNEPGPLPKALTLLGAGIALVYTVVLAASSEFVLRYSTSAVNPWNLFPALYLAAGFLLLAGAAFWYWERSPPPALVRHDWAVGSEREQRTAEVAKSDRHT